MSIGTEFKEPERKCKQDHKGTDGTMRLPSLIDEASMPVVLPDKPASVASLPKEHANETLNYSCSIEELKKRESQALSDADTEGRRKRLSQDDLQ